MANSKFNTKNECEVCKSTYKTFKSKKFDKYLCANHQYQYRKYNRPLEKTDYSPNEYIVHNDRVEIKLHHKHSFISCFIDLEDFANVKKRKWFYERHAVVSYIENSKKRISLHHYILGRPQPGKVIDHIDVNILNNRKSNLRYCTQQQNVFNQGLKSNNTSGRRGVTKARDGKWVAFIGVNYKHIYLGRFKKFDDAVCARDCAEKRYYGEFRRK